MRLHPFNDAIKNKGCMALKENSKGIIFLLQQIKTCCEENSAIFMCASKMQLKMSRGWIGDHRIEKTHTFMKRRCLQSCFFSSQASDSSLEFFTACS
jgi:hypothetical protein